MRVSTAFNRILLLPGASVATVMFTPDGVIVGLRCRSRRLTCPCGWSTSATYDRSTRRWRHLDLGASKLWLEAEIRRLECRACGRVRTEAVPWAHPGARHSRDFEDVVAWLAQRVDKTTITTLLRVSWEAVRNIVERVVADNIEAAVVDVVGVDPFHVIKLANEAIDKTRRWSWNQQRHAGDHHARWVKRTRWALVKDPNNLTDNQLEVLDTLRKRRSVLFRAWLLKEHLRDLYRLDRPTDPAAHLDRWLAWASRSRIPAFVKLAKTIRANRDRILDAIELGLSNSKLEGINSKIRLINHRGYGHHSAAAIIAMLYLCSGGITITLPTQR